MTVGRVHARSTLAERDFEDAKILNLHLAALEEIDLHRLEDLVDHLRCLALCQTTMPLVDGIGKIRPRDSGAWLCILLGGHLC